MGWKTTMPHYTISAKNLVTACMIKLNKTAVTYGELDELAAAILKDIDPSEVACKVALSEEELDKLSFEEYNLFKVTETGVELKGNASVKYLKNNVASSMPPQKLKICGLTEDEISPAP